jgi:hypothetical protein
VSREGRGSSGVTVPEFLDQLPPVRRREVDRLRALIRRHLPAGYEEVVSKRMLVYQVPLARYPDTYNKQPLWYIALASEKSYLSLHLMSVYGDAAQAEHAQGQLQGRREETRHGQSLPPLQDGG